MTSHFRRMSERLQKERTGTTGLFSTIADEQKLFDGCPFAVYRLDRDNRLRYANQAMLDVYGVQYSDLEGKTASEFYDSEAGKIFAESNRILRQNGRILAEVQIHTNPIDGKSQYIEIVRVPLFDEEGSFMGCRCIWWAITDYQGPEVFDTQPERRTGINRHVIDHAMLIDREALIHATSGIKGNLLSFVCESERALVMHHIERAFDEDVVGLFNVYSHGYKTLWSCRIVPMGQGAERVALVHLGKVMLQHRDLIQSAQRLNTITRYCATLAHDLNNLFTVISCNASILEPSDEEDVEIVADITDAIARAQVMVHRMRDFVVDDAMGFEWIDLRDFLSERINKFSKITQDIQLNLSPTSIEGVIYVNPTRFEQVILTLLLLIKNRTPGSIHVQLDVVSAPDHRLELNIHTPELFSSLNAGPSHQDAFEDLVSVDQSVRACGGFLTTQSSPEHPMSFSISLPRIERPAPEE